MRTRGTPIDGGPHVLKVLRELGALPMFADVWPVADEKNHRVVEFLAESLADV